MSGAVDRQFRVATRVVVGAVLLGLVAEIVDNARGNVGAIAMLVVSLFATGMSWRASNEGPSRSAAVLLMIGAVLLGVPLVWSVVAPLIAIAAIVTAGRVVRNG